MSVPPEILAVKRPVNTIVVDNGGKGRKRFAVLERKASVYRPGKGSSPRNGKVVGHIIGGEYMPLAAEEISKEPNILSYGLAALFKKLMEDVTQELWAVYDLSVVVSLMALSNVKLMRPTVLNLEVADLFRASFASLYWRGAALSKNTLYSLSTKIGEDGGRRSRFFQAHVSKLAPDSLVAVGMFKPEIKREVDSLSDFSYMPPPDVVSDIWILYAFCVETGEPICSDTFRGNCEDLSAFTTFMAENGIANGLIINESFSNQQVDSFCEEWSDVYLLSPLDESSRHIGKYKTRPYDGTFITETDITVFFWKDELEDGKFLYSYQDRDQNLKEVVDGPDPSASSYDRYVVEDPEEKQDNSGAIELVCNLDMEPEEVFHVYEKRKLIELALSYYSKHLIRTKTLSYFSVKGNSFINFLCALATCRIVNAAHRAGLLKELTYGDVVDVLKGARRKRGAPLDRLPSSTDPYWFDVDSTTFEVLEALGLCEKGSTEKHKKGRPRKRPAPESTEERPKRPVGRPRKERPESIGPKRPVGRPRKPKLEFVGPKRPVGRPRIRFVDPNRPKRGRGRPRKVQPAQS